MSDFHFEYHILDAEATQGDLGMGGAWDLDGDGKDEIVVGGSQGLLWYRYPDGTRHVIDDSIWCQVGLTAHDLTGDGLPNLVVSTSRSGRSDLGDGLVWYETPQDLEGPWVRHTIEAQRDGAAHDAVFADLDGDGRLELVTTSTQSHNLVWYEVPDDPRTSPWPRHVIATGVLSEGLALADISGNGRLDVLTGPAWYEQPGDPTESTWVARVIAPDYRERCRVQVGDVSGNGVPEVLLVEGEYVDGGWGLFSTADGGQTWERRTFEDETLYFAHTALLTDFDGDGDLDIVLAEMGQGGWNAPRNIRAKVLWYENVDGAGQTWRRHLVNMGVGSHEARLGDVDGDGELEIAGKSWKEPAEVHVFKRVPGPAPFSDYVHTFIDRDKEAPAIDALVVDLDGDGREDVLCGDQWYHAPDWTKRKFCKQSGVIGQVIAVLDVDGDGRLDVIGTKAPGLTNELYWLKAPLDPLNGEWTPYYIGTGDGDWPHGATVIEGLPGKGPMLITGYHSVSEGHGGDWPQYWEIPDDPTQPWTKHTLAEIVYGEEFVVADIDRDGQPDLVAGPYWLDWDGARWNVHVIGDKARYPDVARVRAAPIRPSAAQDNGRLDVVVGEEDVDYRTRTAGVAKVTWFEAPQDPRTEGWIEHVIAMRRCPHSIDVADLDGDGELEIIVGEHDPFMAYDPQAFCKLAVYKRINPQGTAWAEYVIDTRFEHHDGAHVIRLEGGYGIVSHAWKEARYVHLWKRNRE